MSSSSTALTGAFAPRSGQQEVPQARMSPYAHTLRVHGSQVPEQWLVRTHDPKVYPAGVVQTRNQIISSNQDLAWTAKRDSVIAAAAAGIHLAAFAFGVAFWGFEGQPQDRYWPSAVRAKAGLRPGKNGNLVGGRRMYYDYLARFEGV